MNYLQFENNSLLNTYSIVSLFIINTLLILYLLTYKFNCNTIKLRN